MKISDMTRRILIGVILLLIHNVVNAQRLNYGQKETLIERILKAPESVFKKFQDAGMQPENHPLSKSEQGKVERALSNLPPAYYKLLEHHLHSISFMDNMPNTALTSIIESTGPAKMFNITIRASILNETVSDWATQKENSCFDQEVDPTMKIEIEGGELDAIQYILLHEASHVIDGVLEITPHQRDLNSYADINSFTKGIWSNMNTPIEKYQDYPLKENRFRSGKKTAIIQSCDMYRELKETPFVSLYGTASWFEDFAELMTLFHLTSVMNQPYKVVIR